MEMRNASQILITGTRKSPEELSSHPYNICHSLCLNAYSEGNLLHFNVVLSWITLMAVEFFLYSGEWELTPSVFYPSVPVLFIDFHVIKSNPSL